MIEKYRIHQVAKDLGVPSKEIVELVEKYFPDSDKTHMAALESEELSVIFQHYTEKFEVDNLDVFFEESRKIREQEAKEAEPEPEKPVKKKEEPKKQAAKSEPQQAKTEVKKVEPKKDTAKEEQKPAAKKEPQKQETKKTAQKPTQKKQEAHKLETKKLPKQDDKRPAVKHVVEKSDGKKRVDMSSADVNLDRYNERYEKIAPTNIAAKATDQKKQRFPKRRDRRRTPYMSRKEKEEQKRKFKKMEQDRRQNLHVAIPETISVADLAERLKIQVGEIVKKLMALGIMASAGEIIDYDTAAMVAMEIGATVEKEVLVTIEDRLFEDAEAIPEEDLETRPPIIVVMGHVDHGKTSLLDAIRETSVTSGEAGGITQHIGAYQVTVGGRKLTFLYTPGHAAFTSMRARGASVTDIAIIVVAADDGIMPQTIEAINHAKAAEVSIVVAINKMDKPEANPERVKQELTEHGIVPEEWGGDVPVINISAKTGEGLKELLEIVQLTADVKELKASPTSAARGTVVEAELDRGRGPVATLLVQSGTLHQGDTIIAGTALGRVRVMKNDRGEDLAEAGPSTPVEITGLSEVPNAGDQFNAVADEKLAKELVDQRRHEAKEEQFSAYQKVTLDNLFSQISEGEMKELPIIVKADVQGSVEAVTQSLEKLSNEEVRVRVIHGGVGAVNESDVMLADASNAIVVGFNVRPDPVARDTAKKDEVEIRLYRVIYDAIEEIEGAMKGMLDPKFREVDLGRAEVREVFKVSNIGTIAGCYVTEGKIVRNAKIRVVRDGIIIADDEIDSLRRFKDDVKEVALSYECGIGPNKFNDIKVGDFLEAYMMEEYRD